MILRNKLKVVGSTLGVAGVLLLNSGLASATGNASFSLATTSGSFTKGSKVTLAIYENSGTEAINAVQANLSYDASKLDLVYYGNNLSADFTGSAFGILAEASGGSGHIRIGVAVSPPGSSVSGKKLVAKISFNVKAGSGSTSLNFEGGDYGSGIISSDGKTDLWNGNTSGGTFNLKSPTSGSTSKPSSGGSASKPSGSKPSSSGATATITPTEQKKQKANPTEPVVASLNPSDTNNTFLVAIKVLDSKGQPVKGAAVTLGSSTAQTDDSGVAGFVGIAAGTYNVEVKNGGKVLAKSTITVDGAKPANEVQQFDIKTKNQLNWSLIAGIGALILAIIVIIGLLRGGISGHKRRLANKHHGLDGSISPGPTSTTPDGQITPTPPSATAAAPTVITGSGTPSPTTAPPVSKPSNDDNLLKPTVITPTPGADPKP